MSTHERMRDLDDDDAPKKNSSEGRFFEFECPDCNAHNPAGDGFRVGEEVLCCYCGLEFKVKEKGTSFALKPA